MAVSKVSFVGQNASNGNNTLGSFNTTFADQNELFLKVFAGEVLQTFETATVMKPLHQLRTITSGKSAIFPVTGVASAKYHKPGTDLLVDNGHDSASYVTAFRHAEKVINVDDLLVATTFLDKLDEAKNYYDVRSIYTQELGRALARQFDTNTLGLAVLSAATFSGAVPTARTANVTGSGAGELVTSATFNSQHTSGTITNSAGVVQAFIDSLFTMARKMDEKNVPSEERYCVVTPGTYYTLINSSEGRVLINRDFGADPSSSYPGAKLASIAGFQLVKSNIAPSVYGTNMSSLTGQNNTYTGNFSRVVSACFQRQAFGTVKLLDLAMESDYDIRLQGNMMVAKYAMGHGILRPECAGIIASTA